MKKINLRTGVVRVSYPNVDKPVSFNGGPEKYSVSLIVEPESETASNLETAINSVIAAAERDGLWDADTRTNKGLNTPLRLGNEGHPNKDEYAGNLFINASSQFKPSLVHNRKKDGKLVEAVEDEIYAGCYAIASITLYPFNVNGNVGVACGLDGLMKVKNGERLDGRKSAEEVFADVDIAEIDEEGLLG